MSSWPSRKCGDDGCSICSSDHCPYCGKSPCRSGCEDSDPRGRRDLEAALKASVDTSLFWSKRVGELMDKVEELENMVVVLRDELAREQDKVKALKEAQHER